ncbi:major facilitator superfamily MFS_1 [Gemmatirosa kalamazoonensis]|uniref:Major facilitator superfamily MFS_1 n=1 Tax=Gemmatirosa kalamazoonensis TaxID=861299 RepID=W0RGJ4_9BACT|nr:MFS transporter [Gemmatirosa kalamazoonensis]AHG88528.1 major facilitator superfamily MFS_1 [Gemmatirosa kalamazoonensis]
MPNAPRLTGAFLWLLALAAGLSVANLYYNQPLLPDIARTFGVSAARVSAVATSTQVGYAVGLLLFVPLGDLVERRRLVLALLAAVTVALVAASAAPTLPLLAASGALIGATTVVPQILVPLAAGLAPPAARGRVVGRVVSGILVGILAARVVSGAVGRLVGWRAMFLVAAALMLALALALARWLPRTPPAAARDADAPTSYGALLRSLVTLAREQPVLRDAASLGALFFAAFSAFWTTLAFRLDTPPLHYGSAVAGAFGLLGITGALAAPIAGRFADRGTPRRAVGAAIAVNAVAWVLFLLAGDTLWGIAAGVVLLDAGTQAAQVSNQSRIYALPAPLHSRLNTVFMVTYFVGGALGSVAGAVAWAGWGWAGVCGVGFGTLVVAGVMYVAGPKRRDG